MNIVVVHKAMLKRAGDIGDTVEWIANNPQYLPKGEVRTALEEIPNAPAVGGAANEAVSNVEDPIVSGYGKLAERFPFVRRVGNQIRDSGRKLWQFGKRNAPGIAAGAGVVQALQDSKNKPTPAGSGRTAFLIGQAIRGASRNLPKGTVIQDAMNSREKFVPQAKR